jgi:hypothetical protein
VCWLCESLLTHVQAAQQVMMQMPLDRGPVVHIHIMPLGPGAAGQAGVPPNLLAALAGLPPALQGLFGGQAGGGGAQPAPGQPHLPPGLLAALAGAGLAAGAPPAGAGGGQGVPLGPMLFGLQAAQAGLPAGLFGGAGAGPAQALPPGLVFGGVQMIGPGGAVAGPCQIQ